MCSFKYLKFQIYIKYLKPSNTKPNHTNASLSNSGVAELSLKPIEANLQPISFKDLTEHSKITALRIIYSQLRYCPPYPGYAI